MPRGRTRESSWASSKIINEILEEARTVAVVGLSDDPGRPSNSVARTLIQNGYRVVGINPNVDEVLGSICYPTLESVPESIDLVDVFRKPEAIDGLVDEVIRLGIPYLWFQEGVVNPDAALKARDAGVKVIMDRCIAKELARRRF
ncbi:MAG: CoA-binding protein [bacterium]